MLPARESVFCPAKPGQLFLRLTYLILGIRFASEGSMNRTWLYTFVIISFSLLCHLKAQDLKTLKPYYRGEKVLKLEAFQEARTKIEKADLGLLKLWESILTGRAAPLPRIMKERYETLGLNHIFTPSGFHLSAVLFPFMKIIPRQNFQLLFLLLIGGFLFTLPGLMALKRMVLIKSSQKIMGMKIGFISGLILDIFFGSFQNGALSFTYSMLFLGIVYSGLEGINLILWFFIAQVILAYFQNTDISLLILVFSPLVNFSFALLMPLLLLLAIPLWDWQLHSGIFLLKGLQWGVNLFAEISASVTMLEVHTWILVLILLLVLRSWKTFLICLLVTSNSLNLDRASSPSLPSKEFVPKGEIYKTLYREKDVLVYLSDGKCKMKLVRGLWWENCSPLKGSSRKRY